MEPFYFKGDRGRLFGVYHAPTGRAAGGPAVLLCYPAGSEYENSHRTCVHLADGLARAGLHTLRFDYFGCGDSEGEFEEARLEGWLGDIAAAAEQLRSGSGVERIALVGIRFGAALALLAAGCGLSVSHLVLHDPVLDGAAYLEELGRRHREWLLEVSLKNEANPGATSGRDLLGYVYSDVLLQSIGAIDLTEPSSPPARKVLVAESSTRTGLARFTGALERTGAEVDRLGLDARPTWSRPGETLVPLELNRRITRWLREAGR